jgi:hypothetical protein
MMRFHVHVSVDDLDQSMRFYSSLFAAQPTVVKPDYAKWMLDNPRVNFAISKRGRNVGITHLGIQAENQQELAEVSQRLKAAKRPVLIQKGARCCYAEGDKNWVDDPQGISWEAFLTHGEIATFGADTSATAQPVDSPAATRVPTLPDNAAETAEPPPCCG